MRGLQASELLDLVAHGVGRSWPDRADLLLRLALPGENQLKRDALSVGSRERTLLTLRALTFGRRAALRANCPSCSEEVEADVDTREWLREETDSAGSQIQLTHNGLSLVARVPTTGDLRELAHGVTENGNGASGATQADALFARCVRTEDGQKPAVFDESLRAAVARAITEADPLAELRLDFVCPACGYSWEKILDVVSFFWKEIEARASQLAWAVHRLALRYGWSEREILAMGPARRGFYLSIGERA